MDSSELKGDLIDFHVHLAGVPDGNNGCYISPAMQKGALIRFIAWRHGLPLADPARANRLYVERLMKHLSASRRVGKAVVLGMDGVYDDAGRFDDKETDFLVSNDYVLSTVASHRDRLLAGVSINPRRGDAVEEIHRCAEKGAFLVKVLPNTQRFDPSSKSFVPYYRALAARRLPFLSHVGYEFSLWGKDQSVGDPARLRTALDEGATVIAAHGASYGLFLYEKYWDTLVDLVKRYPRFYWDASALTLPNRAGMLLRLRRHPELAERMLFGTDYPLPVFAFPPLLAGKPTAFLKSLWTTNPFDRQWEVLVALGLPPKAGWPCK